MRGGDCVVAASVTLQPSRRSSRAHRRRPLQRTFRVTDTTGKAYALRRPPLGHVLATAHDMGREYKIVSALASTKVPVAPLFGLCADDSVNGSPFYVMGFVDGIVLRNREVALQMPVPVRTTASNALIDTLVDIHEADVDAIGLGDLGRKDGYIARQLNLGMHSTTRRPRDTRYRRSDGCSVAPSRTAGLGHRPRCSRIEN